MNIHPFVTHFPVAFLSVYCLMELLRVRFVTSSVPWFYMKAFVVLVGTAGAAAAYLSGEAAEDLFRNGVLHQLVEVHSRWAKGTVIIFGAISALYAVEAVSRSPFLAGVERFLNAEGFRPYSLLKQFVHYLAGSAVLVFPALAGLLAIIVTGALGGAITYGPDVDPFVRIVYDLAFSLF